MQVKRQCTSNHKCKKYIVRFVIWAWSHVSGKLCTVVINNILLIYLRLTQNAILRLPNEAQTEFYAHTSIGK